MKALRFHEYGEPDVLVVENVPRPTPDSHAVLVKVAASSFNPADVALRSGAFAEMLPLDLPHTLGMDVAGTVVDVGAQVTGTAVGDHVIAFLSPDMTGAAAEYVVVPESLLARAPSSIPLPDSAAFPSTAITAWQALFEHGRLQSGQRVLVCGAGSVVGSYAVQLAVSAGANVIAYAGPGSIDRVAGYGASAVIDYSAQAVASAVPPLVDLVVNFAPSTVEELAPLVRDGGRLVSGSTPVDGARSEITAIRMAAHPDAERLAWLVDEVDAGRLALNISDRRPLEEATAVHSSRERGKTLLIPN